MEFVGELNRRNIFPRQIVVEINDLSVRAAIHLMYKVGEN